MFLLSKLFTPFIIVPGILLIFFVPLFIFLYLRKLNTLRAVLVFFALIFYLSTIEPVADFFLYFLENSHEAYDWNSDYNAEYIIVLGGGFIDSSPDEGGNESLTSGSLKRLIHGFRIHKNTGLPVICVGGKPLKSKECLSEGELYADMLVQLGVDQKKIRIEKTSRNTWENAVQVAKLWKPKKVVLVTSASHINRSVLCFEKNGVSVVPGPTDYKIKKASYDIFSFLPKAENLYNISQAMHEYIGTIIYSIMYF